MTKLFRYVTLDSTIINRIQQELGYSAADETVLKGITRVWAKLEKLRVQATKDQKYAKQYRDFLQTSLKQARRNRIDDDVDTNIAHVNAFWSWFEAECSKRNVSELEASRGRSLLGFCELWLKSQYSKHLHTVYTMYSIPSEAHIDEAKSAATTLLKDYVDYFKDH